MAVHDEHAAERARAWVYLLGAWHAGDDPSTREIRRVTGFGQGRADAFVRDVATWAIENGARVPDRQVAILNRRQGAEQERSGIGAASEQPDTGTTPAIDEHRSGIGAASEQERSVSCARVPLLERDPDPEITKTPGATAPLPPKWAALFPDEVTTTDTLPVAAVEPTTEADPIADAWTALVAWTPRPSAWKLTAQRRTRLRALTKEHGASALLTVATWMTTDHDRAKFLRDRGDPDTLLRGANFATYLALAESGPANDSPTPKNGQSHNIFRRLLQ